MTFLGKVFVLVGLTVCRLGLPILGIWLLGALLKRVSDFHYEFAEIGRERAANRAIEANDQE
jgi:hypothetical protein